MNEQNYEPLDLQQLKKEDYTIRSFDDELRVDQLCTRLLRRFFEDMTGHEGFSPLEAGELCHGADYFLRDFLVADRHLNLFETTAEQVRQFAGHWYIVRTPEPNMTELAAVLAGIHAFYHYLAGRDLVSAGQVQQIIEACGAFAFYRERIETFWAIEGDGFLTWRQACPLPAVPDYP